MCSKLPGKVGPSPKLGFAPLAYGVHVGCARESQPGNARDHERRYARKDKRRITMKSKVQR